MRHGSGAAQDQGRPARRRRLRHLRAKDFHFRRRARSLREHRSPRARAHRRRADGHEGHFDVHRPQIPAQRGWVAWRPQRRVLRLDRAQDGHPRQRDLRAQLRRRERLAGRRRKPRPQRDVRDDERRPARRRHSRPQPLGSRLSERRRLREGTTAGPRADGRQGAGQARRSLARASRRQADAARNSRLQRSRARADRMGGFERRRSASLARRRRAPGGRGSPGAA